MSRLPRSLSAGSAVLLVALPGLPAAAAREAVPAPALGDWEGIGPHGLPLSFAITRERFRIRGRTRVIRSMRDLVVGFPVACADVTPSSQVFDFPTAGYAGPGAPPVTFRFKNPHQFDIYIGSAPGFNIGIGFVLAGRWSTARRGIVSEPGVKSGLRRCGWGMKTLTWRLSAAKRPRVQDGAWTGTISATGTSGGAVEATVGAGGRSIDRFRITYSCSDGGSSSLAFSPAFTIAGRPTSEFISATGSFFGTSATVNGVRLGWNGTFGADGILRGTFTDRNACRNDNDVLNGTFTASHAPP